MTAKLQQSILIVEDDARLAEMLTAYFSVQGYAASSSGLGEEGLARAAETIPDLIILDINLPDLDGFAVCKRLRKSHKTRAIPVLFLTERSERESKREGLGLGVVDYVTKPFDIQELLLRVRNILRRVASASEENPVTGLPEGAAIREALDRIVGGEMGEWGLLAASLRGLDAFRELYGFIASDDVLRVTALTITSAAVEIGGPGALTGHLDDHTFLVILSAANVLALETRINQRLAGSLEYFYPGDNRGPSAITADRLRLSMARLAASASSFTSPDEIVDSLLAALQQEGLYT